MEEGPLAGKGAVRFARLATALMFFGSACFLAVLPFLAPEQPERALGSSCLLAVSLWAGHCLYQGRVAQAVRALVYGTWLVVGVATVVGGGVRTPMAYGYPVIVVLAGWLLGRRTATLLAFATIAWGLGLVLAERHDLLPQGAPAPPLMMWIVQSLVTVVAAVLALEVVRSHESRRLEAERLGAELEQRMQERTAELTEANRELESFAHTLSHDLRSPLRGIDGFSQLLNEEYAGRMDAQGREYLTRVRGAAQRMGSLIDDILELSRVSRQAIRSERLDLSWMAGEILEGYAKREPSRRVRTVVHPGCLAMGDASLVGAMLQDLIDNAWKYTRRAGQACIEFGAEGRPDGPAFFVRDNGVGFDERYAAHMFRPFQRLHPGGEFEGTGIGLASAARVAERHGGRIWARGGVGEGATFYFTLPGAEASAPPPKAAAEKAVAA